METNFKQFGYFLEYFIEGKFIGTKKIVEKDREKIGYYSKIEEIAHHNILLDNNKKIKIGQKYYTRLYPLCGRLKQQQTNT